MDIIFSHVPTTIIVIQLTKVKHLSQCRTKDSINTLYSSRLNGVGKSCCMFELIINTGRHQSTKLNYLPGYNLLFKKPNLLFYKITMELKYIQIDYFNTRYQGNNSIIKHYKYTFGNI